MIKIHYDFTDGTEVSYIEGLELKDNFTTNCLDFFLSKIDAEDVVVYKKDGSYVSRNELLTNPSEYTGVHIKACYNFHKLLKANTFKFKIPNE